MKKEKSAVKIDRTFYYESEKKHEYQNFIRIRNQTAANSFQTPAVLFANPKNLYQRRAKRLRELAQNHPLSDYLLFAADIVESQLSTLERNPLPPQQFEQLNDIEPLNAKTFKRKQHLA